MKNLVKYLGVFAAATMLMTSCQKDPSGTGSMVVKMKDAPTDFDSVNVEVLSTEVHYSNSPSGWVTLPTNSGVYDLLLLQNDVTAVLANSNQLPVGDITQMRLILGSTNYVVVDSLSFPLDLSSQDKTGLKFNLNTTVNAGDSVEVLIDFDAAQSIVETGNGKFKLKPVIKVEDIVYY